MMVAEDWDVEIKPNIKINLNIIFSDLDFPNGANDSRTSTDISTGPNCLISIFEL